jgi:hypothetical protein
MNRLFGQCLRISAEGSASVSLPTGSQMAFGTLRSYCLPLIHPEPPLGSFILI